MNASAAVTSELVEQAITWRHHLHGIPEIAYQEHETSRFVAERLGDMGLSVTTGLAGTGLVATLRKGSSRRVIGLRADMDALPMNETGELPYRSRNPGRMHACGHDGHMSMLLGAAQAAAGVDFDGTVHFIFQPAEENEAGAKAMMNDGLFKSFPVDAVFGIHNWPGLKPGTFSAAPGPVMAAFSTFDITVNGTAAHGAMPHQGADPVLAASQIVAALQTIVSRNVAPTDTAVLSVTQIHGGNAYNIIPASVVLRGTGRWFSDKAGDLLQNRLTDIARAVAAAYGCTAEIDYQRRYPATVNAAAQAVAAQDAGTTIGLVHAAQPPSMASEDFAFMLQEIPGCYAWLGAGREGHNPGLHASDFNFNDAVMADGIKLWLSVLQTQLPQG